MASIYAHQAGIFKNCLLGAIMNKRKLTYYSYLFACEQFIPMCIGNTVLINKMLGICADYPYVYREHAYMRFSKSESPGLSLCV